MAKGDPIQVMAGFSLTNRWLLYASLMLTPAQALSGVGSHSPTNIGFLAYNYYQQYLWYTAAKSKQIHALALLPTYLDLIYAVTYLGGIPAGNVPMGILLGLGTAGLLLMNTITAWIALKTNLPEGDGVYQFFFFGWRTLSKGWRKLMTMWQVFDTLTVVIAVIGSIVLGVIIPLNVEEDDVEDSEFKTLRDTAIFWGSVLVLACLHCTQTKLFGPK